MSERGNETNGQILRRWTRRVLPWVLLSLSAWLIFEELAAGAGIPNGTEAPALVAQLSDGQEFDLEAHRGEVVVVNFWATWCPPCRAEAPALSAAHDELGAEGSVVGLSLDQADLPTVHRAARDMGMDYPIGRAYSDAVERFAVTQLPTTYVIAGDGHIAWSAVGEVSESELSAAIADARAHSGH